MKMFLKEYLSDEIQVFDYAHIWTNTMVYRGIAQFVGVRVDNRKVPVFKNNHGDIFYGGDVYWLKVGFLGLYRNTEYLYCLLFSLIYRFENLSGFELFVMTSIVDHLLESGVFEKDVESLEELSLLKKKCMDALLGVNLN